MSLLLALALASHITPVLPLPKGTGLPPPGTEEAAVMAPVDGLLAAIAARDPAAMAKLLRDGGGATAAVENADGSHTLVRRTWPEMLVRFAPGPEHFLETLTDPAVEVDGDIAMVWGRYDFRIDGKLHHCGYDHFDLVRDGGTWKIANISWSQRTTGCAG